MTAARALSKTGVNEAGRLALAFVTRSVNVDWTVAMIMPPY
jgi:hypothetical protein